MTQYRNVGRIGCDGGYPSHTGIDFSGDNDNNGYDTPILASAPGEIFSAVNVFPDSYNTCGSPHYGNNVVIRHNYNGTTFYTLYAHLKKGGIRTGGSVERGDVIGYQGYTGNSCPAGLAGTHLHFEIRTAPPGYGGVWNPLPFLP
jgi:murein DD-endopeptidase MepM/ murein hydrolase activator NlpD